MNQNIYINEIPSAEVTIYDNGTPVTVVIANGAASGVPYTGATQNVDLGEYGISAGFVQLDTTPTTYTPAVGNIGYNDTVGTLETTLKGGNVSLKIGRDMFERVVNKTGVQLTKASYQAVRVSTAQGQRLGVALAQANNDNNSADTIGLAVETIDNNQEGMIFTVGEIGGINTTGSLQGETWADGDVLYLSPTTAGRVTNVKPVAPQHLVVMGYVVYAHANQGKIYVKIMNGWELGELHDVNTTGATNGQVLTYNGSIWIPSTNGSGTVTQVNALTLGTSGTDLSSAVANSTTTPTITLNVPTASATNRGVLSSSDWTTFNNKLSSAVTSLNSLTASSQTFATGTTGTDFNISSSTSTHIFNLPDAGTSSRGLVSTGSQTFAGTKTFSGFLNAGVLSTTNYANTTAESWLGSSNTSYYSFWTQVPAISLLANSNVILNRFTNSTVIEAATGTHLLIANVGIKGLDVSNNTATTTNGASLYIEGAASGGAITNNYAFWVDSGLVRLDGDLELQNIPLSSTSNYLNYDTTTKRVSYSTLTNPVTGTGVSGQVAYWSGTTTQTGSATFTFSPTAQLLVNNAVTASSAIARGTNLTPSLTASANNDVLVGLDINPTFTNGAFTGVTNTGLRITGNVNATFPAIIIQNTSNGVSATNVFRAQDNSTGVCEFGLGGASHATLSNVGYFYTNKSILDFYASAGHKMRIYGATGNLVIQNGGTFTDSGQRLQVTGDTLLKGSGNTSGSTALTVQNSDGTSILNIRNDGAVQIGSQSTTQRPYLAGYTGFTEFGVSQTSLGIVTQNSGRPDPGILIRNTSNFTHTSNTGNYLVLLTNYSPTSGTGLMNNFVIQPTINQTGGANGITRGIFIAPTLTAAADWRSIETSNNSGYALYLGGSADAFFNDGTDFQLGTTTGTKIGTATSQKLGFWNATPIVQPTTGVASATRVGGGGTALTDTDTFDGYTLAQIVKALRNTGILA